MPPLTPYFVMRVGRRLPIGAVLSAGQSGRWNKRCTMRPAIARAVLLANHGPVVSGKTLTDAVYAAEELEEAAKLFMLLRNVPDARLLTPAQVDDLVATFG